MVRPGAHPASGGHLAYIPGGGIYHSALGDFLAAVSNKYAGLFFTGPGPVRMENLLIRWVADLVGYPASAGGSIASGGSIATLTAIITARDAHGLKGADYASAVVYLTDAGPSLHRESSPHRRPGRSAGPSSSRSTSASACGPRRWRQAIAEDRAQGLKPWLIIAAAGTTDTGAVDPLDAIATIAERERCWFHVDAAYGGFFLLTEHGRSVLRGHRAVRLGRPRSAQEPVPPLGLRDRAGAGRQAARGGPRLLRRYSYMQDACASPARSRPPTCRPS